MNTNEILRYGTILTDDEVFDICNEFASCVRIMVISYEGNIYYIKSVTGEVVELKKVGVACHMSNNNDEVE